MSQENVEIVRRAWEAFFARDMEAAIAYYDEGCEFFWPRNVSYHGHEGLRQAFADVFDTWEDIHFEIEESREVDDQVVFLGRATVVGKRPAPTVSYEGAWVNRVRAGKITYSRPYSSHAEALEAVGLSE